MAGCQWQADSPTEPHTSRNSLEEPHRPQQAGPMLSQPVFDGKVLDGYVELLNFEKEGTIILQMKMYDINDEEKVPIKRQGQEWLQFKQNLTNAEKDTLKNETGLFKLLKVKFRLQLNKTILAL